MRKLKLFSVLMCLFIGIGQVWGDDAKVNDILWKEAFTGGSSSTTFSATSSWSTGTGTTMFVSGDKSSISYSASNAMLSTATAGGIDESHAWLKKSTTGYFEVDSIPVYNATKVQVSLKKNNKTVVTFSYKRSGDTNWTDAGTTGSASNTSGSSSVISVTPNTKICLKFTRNSNNDASRIDDLTLTVTEIASGGGSSDPTLSLTPTSWDFGPVATTGAASKDFSVSGSNLTAGTLTISAPSGYSVSPNSIDVSAGTLSATNITVSKNTTTANTYNGNLSVYGGGVAQANAVTASLSMTVVAPVEPEITFNNGTVEVGEDLDLSSLFTSNSEGAVTYTITAGGSNATLSGSTLTGSVIGDVTVQATQAANAGYVEKSVTATINVVAALSKSILNFTDEYGDGGATADDDAVWTVTSDGTEAQYDGTKGIHYGASSAAVQYIRLSTSDINGTIKKIVVNASTASGVTATVSVTVGGSAFGGDAQNLSSTATEYTFNGSASGEIIVTITKPSSANKALYCKSIIVSYEAAPDEPAVTVDPTSVSFATPDAVDDGVIDVTYTNIDETQITVTLSDDEDGNVPFSGSWLTANLNVDKDIAYTVTENSGDARSAYIRLTAKASNGTSPDVVKKIQVTQVQGIPTYTTLDAIFAAATSSNETVKVSFNNWVVSAVTTDKAYVTDGTYGLIIYTASHGFEVGDILSGTKQTQLKKYNGNSQLSGLKASDFVKTTGGIITPRVVSDPTTLSGANAGSVVKISGELTEESSKYYIGTIQIYNGLSYDFGTPTTGNVYDCTGVFAMFGSTKEVMPRQDGDLVESVETPTAVISFNDFSIEKGQNTTLSAIVSPVVAASAEVFYSIVDGDDKVSLAGAVLTANEVGTAHIRATVADNLPDYNGATKDITVTVTPVDSRYTAVINGLTAISGTLVTETAGTHKDKEYISYEAKRGKASNDPIIPSGKTFVRIYQNGGYLAVSAVKGCLIDEVIVDIPSTCNSTTIAVGTDEENLPTTGGTAAEAGNTFTTGTGMNSQNVYLVCRGTTNNTRLEVGAITVKYSGDPISVTGVAVSGTYQTEFTKNSTFNHTGVVVTATYSDASHGDVSALAEFSEPDMTTTGEKTITVSYGGKSTTYTIEVVNPTVTGISLSGTYPTRFNVGDAFSHTGMTVTAEFNDFSEDEVTDDATFTGYNMSVGGVQTVTVSYGGESATYSIIVTPANTDVMVASNLVATSTDYTAFSDVNNLGTDAVYAGENAKSSEGAIQLRTKNSREGIVVTTANGSKIVKSVSIAYQTPPTNERKLQVYGKHTAYESAADLYGEAAGTLIGEIAANGSLDCTATEEYEYIGLRSFDGAIYVAVIMIEWADPTPTTYAVTYVSAHGSAPAATNAAAVTLEELTEAGWTHNGWVANVDVEVNSATVTAGTLIVNGTEVVLSAATQFTAQWTENPPVGPDYTEVRSGLVAGRHYTVCLEKAVTAVKGATFWSLTYKNSENTAAYLVQEEVPFAAGKPYIIQATDDNEGKLEVAYEGDAEGAPVANGALRGTFNYMDAAALAAVEGTVYMLFNNELRPIGTNNHLDAHRAYVLYNLLTVPSTSNFAPGKKVKSMPLQKDVATGMDELNASEAPVKVMIDGKFYILRGEKMYDATGKLVK